MKVVKEEEEEDGDLCDGCEGGIYALQGGIHGIRQRGMRIIKFKCRHTKNTHWQNRKN